MGDLCFREYLSEFYCKIIVRFHKNFDWFVENFSKKVQAIWDQMEPLELDLKDLN